MENNHEHRGLVGRSDGPSYGFIVLWTALALAGAAFSSTPEDDARPEEDDARPETVEIGPPVGYIAPQSGRLVLPDNEQGRTLATGDRFRGLNFVFPVAGATFHSIEYTETYGFTDFRNTWRRNHFGTDIFAPAGTPVAAAADGVVTIASFCPAPGPGYKAAVYHGRGVYTYYLHMESINVVVGQPVSAGEPIAAVGATGNALGTPTHLHFEMDFAVEAQSRPRWLVEYAAGGLRPGVALTKSVEPLGYVCEHEVRLRPPRGLYLSRD